MRNRRGTCVPLRISKNLLALAYWSLTFVKRTCKNTFFFCTQDLDSMAYLFFISVFCSVNFRQMYDKNKKKKKMKNTICSHISLGSKNKEGKTCFSCLHYRILKLTGSSFVHAQLNSQWRQWSVLDGMRFLHGHTSILGNLIIFLHEFFFFNNNLQRACFVFLLK